MKERKLEYLDKTIALKDEYKNLLKDQKLKETEEELINYLKRQWIEIFRHNWFI